MNRAISIVVFLCMPLLAGAQLWPREGSKLNYRIVGFSFPRSGNKARCKIEIAKGNFNTEALFDKNIIRGIDCNTNRTIAEVPLFGSEYTWRVEDAPPGKAVKKGAFHHFSTVYGPAVDTGVVHLKVVKSAEKYSDAFVFVDGNSTLYDMDGNPVWFLPNYKQPTSENIDIRDLKLSPQGTLTFLGGGHILEVNYNGDTLWRDPKGKTVSLDTSEHYNHEFTRLANGNYMVLGNQNVKWELPNYKKDPANKLFLPEIIKDSNGKYYQKIPFGTVIEYNPAGKVVWHWRSSDYFKTSDFYSHRERDGSYKVKDVHENSFFFDEKNKMLYVGFRDISGILKIKYPEGKVVATYGPMGIPGAPETGKELFHGQHSCRVSSEGYLYIFNNNSFRFDYAPRVDVFQEPATAGDTLKKVWEFVCPAEATNLPKPGNTVFRNPHKPFNHLMTSGGNVLELPDSSFFVSMNGPVSTVFIVDRDKNIAWKAFPERKESSTGKWLKMPLYRASIITRQQLEALVWGAER